MASTYGVKQDIIKLIESVDCRPETFLIPGGKAKEVGTEFVEIFWLGTSNGFQYRTNENEQILLMQINLAVKSANGTKELYDYADAMSMAFSQSRIVGDAVVVSAPSQNEVGDNDNSGFYRIILTLTLRYVLDDVAETSESV